MARKKAGRKGGSGTGTLVSIVFLIAGGLGGFNYHRNLALEEAKAGARPFQGYTDEALEELAAAYGDQADSLERKYRASLERVDGVRDADGLIMEKVAEFERVQKIGDSVRLATSQVADAEARLRQIQDEQTWRSSQSQWSLHLKRLTTI
ncbi:MAG: hypothetical protein QF570_16185 [Myxococcota bacterium]|jgi:hypothetical protein|nr:hypothetical protein [Myxococcota bacterium]